MKIIYVLSLLSFFFIESKSQTSYNKYWIQFTDKSNTSYSIDHPEAFLSERCINKRIKFNIPIDSLDIPINQTYIDSLIKLGAKVLTKSKWFNAVTIEVSNPLILNSIFALSFVKNHQKSITAKKNHKIINKLEETTEVVDYHPKSYKNEFDYGYGYNQIAMLNGQMLHNQFMQGEEMIIAVLDGGFYKVNELPAFDSIRANNQILGTFDFVTGDTMVYEDNNHGMMVLSIIASNMPGKLVGTAPKAKFWLLRTEDTSSETPVEEDNWACGAEFADSVGADIINTSLGYTNFDSDFHDYTYADMNGITSRSSIAADIASQKGILVEVSAGNEGNKPWLYIAAPADAKYVLSVGAVDSLGMYAAFSSIGPSYDGRVKPNIVAKGQDTYVQYSNGAVGKGNGTSFSGPVISGLAACLWQANPNKTNLEIIAAIEKSARQSNNPSAKLGYGIPDFAKANFILKDINYYDFTHDNIINVYPNPFTNEFDIQFYSTQSNVSIEVFDVIGKRVLFTKNTVIPFSANKLSIKDLSLLQKGTYFVKIKTSNGVYTCKIAKM